jgi:osmotically-inducible protein OsmY
MIHGFFTTASHHSATIVAKMARYTSRTAGEAAMKPDLMLQEDIAVQLALDASVDAPHVGVTTKNGIVTLSGVVASFADKFAAEQAAKRVPGVRAIASELVVDVPAFRRRNDTELADTAVTALAWEDTVPGYAVTVQVENGWLTLEGAVERHSQRDNAERAVRHLSGVRGVTNLIQIVSRVKDAGENLVTSAV